MTAATQTTLGEIKLAGDLGGNNNANAPELSTSGVTAGTYTIPIVTFDAKGRATSASSASSSTVTAMVPSASSTQKGIASFNSTDFTVSAGAVSLNTGSLPTASGSTFGLVKSGTNVTNTAGVLSIPDASTSVKGVASFNSSAFSTSAGVVSLNYSSLTQLLTPASSSVFGVVKSGANINNSSGTLSIADATTSVKGVASFNSTDFTVSSGAVSLVTTLARTNVQNTWQKAQAHTASTLTYASTITPDFSLSNVFTLTATGNFTLANPTNVQAGTTYLIIVTQDATGGRTITWGSNFKFGAGGSSTLSSTANARDVISIVAVTSSILLVTIQKGF